MNKIIENKKTKIIATLGPSCDSVSVLKEMIVNGTNMFRINASHNADYDHLKKVMTAVSKATKKANVHVGVFLDLQGPKIRLGEFQPNKEHIVKVGQKFVLTTREVIGNEKEASLTYESFHQDVKLGDPIYINDGKIRMEVQKVKGQDVTCKVTRGGELSNFKGVNLPRTEMSVSPFTKKDQKDAKTAIKLGVDYIALSFVSKPEDIQTIRDFLKKHKASHIKIISKIERQAAIDHLEEVIEASDVVMVARGDLGVEIGVEKVPKVQKKIIREANKRTKPVIVATQMLETMITSETATRAEVSDVANAIYDNCDAVMLSGETAVGINPPNVIKTMSNISLESDKHIIEIKKEYSFVKKEIFLTRTQASSFCKAAEQIAEENQAKAIMAFTSSGNTPLIASKIHSIFPIIAPTDQYHVCKQMTLFRSVVPILMPKAFKSIHRWTDMISIAVKEAVRLKYLEKGDTVVVTAGIPIGVSNGINSIRIITV